MQVSCFNRIKFSNFLIRIFPQARFFNKGKWNQYVYKAVFLEKVKHINALKLVFVFSGRLFCTHACFLTGCCVLHQKVKTAIPLFLLLQLLSIKHLKNWSIQTKTQIFFTKTKESEKMGGKPTCT